MPVPWYITAMSQVFSFPQMLVYPYILLLEALRGSLISGLSMGLFIEEEDAPVESVWRDLTTLRIFLDRMKWLIDLLPAWARPLLGPHIDYYWAAECFYDIMQNKALHKQGFVEVPEDCTHAYCTYGKPTPKYP